MPPSAMMVTLSFSSARAQSLMAVICGTPTPATTRVVQIDPGPMPTLTASAPALASASAASPVATLPAMIWALGKLRRTSATACTTARECPCAVSMQMTSQPAASSASTRSSRSAPMPTAAPARRLPRSSLAANGCCCAFSMSLMVIRPLSSPLVSTTSSFSMRFRCSSSFDPSRLVPSAVVMSLRVIIALTGWSRLRSKRMSRLVTMPTGRPSAATTGRPEISCRRINSTATASFCSGAMVTGLMTTPVSAFLTFVTSSTCSAMVKFLCTIPMPPSRAMQIAVAASVTVSIADETMGFARRIPGSAGSARRRPSAARRSRRGPAGRRRR